MYTYTLQIPPTPEPLTSTRSNRRGISNLKTKDGEQPGEVLDYYHLHRRSWHRGNVAEMIDEPFT